MQRSNKPCFVDGSLIEPEIALPTQASGADGGPPRKVAKNDYDLASEACSSASIKMLVEERQCASQPAHFKASNHLSRTPSTSGHSSEAVDPGFGGFTQPAQLSDLFCPTQGSTQATQSSRFQRLVKRMTRFWVKVSLEETDKFLHGLLEKMHYSFKCKPKGIVSIS